MTLIVLNLAEPAAARKRFCQSHFSVTSVTGRFGPEEENHTEGRARSSRVKSQLKHGAGVDCTRRQ